MSERDAVQEVFRSAGRVGAWIEDVDPDRVVEGWIMKLDQTVVGTRLDGEASSSRIRSHAVDRWLRTVDPRDVLCRLDHGGEPLGRWFEFRKIFDRGLMGSLLVDDGRRGDRL